MKKLAFLLILIVGVHQYICAQVVINEFSCANNTVIADNYGEYEDWIELYNAGISPVDLTGCFLSDNINIPTKWTIPADTINPGEYRIYFASKRNSVSGGYSHTNFKLKQTANEELVFADPLGIIIDSITIRPTQLNHSTGRTTNGASTWSIFEQPTPNAANVGAYIGYAAKPIFSIASGFYTGTQNLALVSTDSNCTIRYTTDGSNPSLNSAVYVALSMWIQLHCLKQSAIVQ